MKAGKVWGETSVLLSTPHVEVHALSVEPHAHCSLHRHTCRWNAFVGITGRIFVEVHQEDYDLVDVTEVTAGTLTTVPPGLWHRFRTEAEGAECLEVYYPPSLGAGDIVRRDVGGRE